MDSWLQHWQLRFIACVPLFRHLREKLKDTFSIRSEKNGSVLGLGSQTPNLQTHFRIRSYFISLISISRTIDLCRATLYIARPIPYAAVYVRLYLYQCIALSRKRYKIGCGTPIGTRVRCIEWCHFQWFEWPTTRIWRTCHYSTLNISQTVQYRHSYKFTIEN